MGSKGRLFSEDGIDASHARTLPSCTYLPDESTLNEIKYLFTTLKSTQKGEDYLAGPLNIRNMPYSADLAQLTSDATGAVLSLEDVINGMCRIATHFVSNHQLIQARANAYLRCKLAGAEMLINGVIQSQNEQSVERDQILLTSATVPSSPRDYNNNHELTREDSMGRLSRASSRRELGPASDRMKDCATPPPSTLFRSPSVGHEHLNSFAPNLFTMDDNTLSAALNFLPELFQNNGFVSSKDLSPYDANKLAELWEFFDLDDDGIVTRDDILLGLSNIAKYYLATDDFTQLLANSYVQRKIRKAVYAIDKYQRSAAPQNTAQYSANDKNKSKSAPILPVRHEPGATVIYTDEEGNHHVTKIIRMSQRQVAGGDAYYIETKGVKLCVAASRLRVMDAQDSAMLERLDQNQNSIRQKPQQPKDAPRSSANSNSLDSNSNSQSSSSSARKDARAPDIKASPRNAGGSSSSGSTVTPAKVGRPSSHHQETGTVGEDTPSSASKGGILGYLKSSIGILGIGGGKAAVSPATVIPENQNNHSNLVKRKGSADNENNHAKVQEVQVYGDGRDADSVLDGEDGASYVEVEGVPVVPESEGNSALQSSNSRTSNSQLHSRPDSRDSVEQLGPGETVPVAVSADLVSVSAPGNTPRDAVPAVAVVAGTAAGSTDPAALSSSTSQRLKQSAAMLALDGEILQAVRKVTGPTYKLTRNMFPKPKKTEPYPIYFNRGKNGFFEFNQVDFGVQFIPFMKDMVIPALDPRWQSHSDTLSETNRCFFLHFGVAMGLHPVSLQQCFRNAAAELLRFPENEMTIFFGEALESLLLRNDFVDAQVLSAIWPLEFDKYKVLIVRVDHNGRIESFTSFRSEAGPVDENGEWNGEELIFTLQWNHFTILKPKSDQLSKPITAVLAAASMIGIMPLEFITKVDPDPAKRFKIC